MSVREKPRIAILASGSGTTAEAFIKATQDGVVDADVSLVICNNPPEKAGIYERVERLNDEYGLQIEMAHISGPKPPEGIRGISDEESQKLVDAITRRNIALVAFMGYMKIIRGPLLDIAIPMVNTHPGPLPETADTYGLGASEKVLRLGLPESKHTVHYVIEGVDQGAPIMETPVPILPSDDAEDVFQRVQETEKKMLPLAIAKVLAGDVR